MGDKDLYLTQGYRMHRDFCVSPLCPWNHYNFQLCAGPLCPHSEAVECIKATEKFFFFLRLCSGLGTFSCNRMIITMVSDIKIKLNYDWHFVLGAFLVAWLSVLPTSV